VRVGQEAEVTVDALPGRRFTARVVRLAPAFDPVTRTLDAEVDLPNPKARSAPGCTAAPPSSRAVHPAGLMVPGERGADLGRPRYVFVIDGEKAQAPRGDGLRRGRRGWR
jgi:multidrug efflux pump subunit AcrA (membrane-fusion protein)